MTKSPHSSLSSAVPHSGAHPEMVVGEIDLWCHANVSRADQCIVSSLCTVFSPYTPHLAKNLEEHLWRSSFVVYHDSRPGLDLAATLDGTTIAKVQHLDS